jgi:hypothetical protein
MIIKATIEEDLHGHADEAERAFREANDPPEEDEDEETTGLLPRLLAGEVIEGYETTQTIGTDAVNAVELPWLFERVVGTVCRSQDIYDNDRALKEILFYCGTNAQYACALSERLGCLIVLIEPDAYEDINRFLEEDRLKEIADAGFKLGLVVGRRSLDEDTNKAERAILFKLQAAGIKATCKYLRFVPNKLGKTIAINNEMALSVMGFPEMHHAARRLWHNGGLWAGPALPPERLVKPNTEAEIVTCGWKEIAAEKQAVELLKRITITHKTPGMPSRLDDFGRLPELELDSNVPFTFMRVAHGGGKTYRVKQICNEINKLGGTSIHICPLRTLVTAAEDNYGAIGRDQLIDGAIFSSTSLISKNLFNHEDEEGNVQGRDISLCPESLTELSKIGMSIAKLQHALDLDANKGKTVNLILDELPSTLERLQESSTIKKVGLTLKTFAELIQFVISTGGRVICMSADMTQSHIDLMLRLGGFKASDVTDPAVCNVINPTFACPQDYKRTVMMSQCINATTLRFIAAVEEGIEKQRTTLLLVNIKSESNTKSTRTFESLVKRLVSTDARILCIDADSRAVVNSEEYLFMEATAVEQMEMMSEYDVIISTGCITSGVNWDSQLHAHIPDDVIHRIFVVETGKWGATNALQAANRARNPDIAVEIYAPNKPCHTKHFGFNPTTDDIKKQVSETADEFALMLKGIDSDIEIADNSGHYEPPIPEFEQSMVGWVQSTMASNERDQKIEAHRKSNRPWFHSYCERLALEQVELANPYVAIRSYAAINGYRIIDIDDSHMPVFEKTHAAQCRKKEAVTNTEVLSCLLGGTISVESAERIRQLTSSLQEEINICSGLRPEGIKARIAEIVADNVAINAELMKAKTRKERKAKHQSLKSYALLSDVKLRELRALLLLSRMSEAQIIAMQVDDSNPWLNEDVRTAALEMLARKGAVDEQFIEDVTKTQYAALCVKARLTPTERLMKLRGDAADIAVLDFDFSNQNDWSPTDWCRFARSRMPSFLFTRMLLTLEDKHQDTLKKYFLRKSKDEMTAARLLMPAASIKAARALATDGVAKELLQFEGRYAVKRSSNLVEVAASALGVTVDELIVTNEELVAISKKQKAMWDFVVRSAMARPEHYPNHKVLTDATPNVVRLGEALLKNRQRLSGMFDSLAVKPKGTGANQKWCFYLSKALTEISRSLPTKVVETRTSSNRQQYWVLLERSDLIAPDVASQWIKRTWNRLSEAVKMDDSIKTLLDGGDF